MSTVKKEARLSGMLLARKGAAAPAHTDHKLTIQAMDQFGSKTRQTDFVEEASKDEGVKEEWVEAVSEIAELTQKQNNALVEPPKVVQKDAVESSKTEQPPVKNTAKAGKRIAMTLRMEQNDHLKLRLYAAHSRKSCQDIISDALEMYLSEEDKVCNISDCSCLKN